MANVGKYAFLAGVGLAVIMAFVSIPNAALILAVLGLIVGFLNVTASESQGFLISAIALMLTAVSLGVIPAVGEWLARIGVHLAAFVAPAALVVALKSLLESAKD